MGAVSLSDGAVNVPQSVSASTSADLFSIMTGHLRDENGNWQGYAPIGDHDFDDLSHDAFGKVGDGDRFGIIASWDITDSPISRDATRAIF